MSSGIEAKSPTTAWRSKAAEPGGPVRCHGAVVAHGTLHACNDCVAIRGAFIESQRRPARRRGLYGGHFAGAFVRPDARPGKYACIQWLGERRVRAMRTAWVRQVVGSGLTGLLVKTIVLKSNPARLRAGKYCEAIVGNICFSMLFSTRIQPTSFVSSGRPDSRAAPRRAEQAPLQRSLAGVQSLRVRVVPTHNPHRALPAARSA